VETWFPWIFVLFLLLIIGLGVWNWYLAEKRKKELKEWAEARGLSFRPDNDSGYDSRFGFACLNQGDNRYAYNIMEGRYAGRPICAFDYHYQTYSTDSKGNRTTHHHYFSAVVIETGLPLKPLRIREENFFDKVGEFFGFDDIDFESHEFSTTFHVSSPDRKWAFDVLPQVTMEFLLKAPRFSLEMKESRLIAYRGSTFGASSFEAALDVAGGVLDRLPTYLLRELKGEP
jgi:hypothetical protein